MSSLEDKIREKLGKKVAAPKPASSTPPTPRVIVKRIEVSPEMKAIFYKIHENADKAWGFDNSTGKERAKPKYKNIWDIWLMFKEWFEREVVKE